MLRAAGISKHFMGIQALRDVSMHVDSREILGVIGPNGAGKTTLFNLLTGLFMPDSGSLALNGAEITRMPPYRRVRLGMARTFQNLEIFRDMSVLENVMVGGHIRLRAGFWGSMFYGPPQRREERAMKKEALTFLELLGIADLAGQPAVSLSYGNQRRVEIARALISKPSLLFLDEPAAGMNPNETQELSDLIISLAEGLKLTVLIIEHDMNLIMDICSRIVVMAEGTVLTSGTPQEIRSDQRVLDIYLGGEV